MITAAEFLDSYPGKSFDGSRTPDDRLELEAKTQFWIDLAYQNYCCNEAAWNTQEKQLQALKVLVCHFLESERMQKAFITGIADTAASGSQASPPSLNDDHLKQTIYGQQFISLRDLTVTFGVG